MLYPLVWPLLARMLPYPHRPPARKKDCNLPPEASAKVSLTNYPERLFCAEVYGDLAYLLAPEALLYSNPADKTAQMYARGSVTGHPKTPSPGAEEGLLYAHSSVTHSPKACTRLSHAVFTLASFTIWFAVHYLRNG